jgi:hypothetical protein
MEARSLSKRLDALSAQHGGKIPFGSMKGPGKGKGKTTKRAGNKSKKHRRTSMKSKGRKSKGRASKHKGKPSMSPKHLGEKVIQRGEDGDLYKVKRGKWVKVDFGK